MAKRPRHRGTGIAFYSHQIELPTRRWECEEFMRDREEGLHRFQTGDTVGWMEGLARNCVNQPERLPLRYGGSVDQAVAASRVLRLNGRTKFSRAGSRPELLATEAQAIRLGDVWLAANAAELFTSLGLELRRRWGGRELFLLGYSNGSLGYLPDAYEFARRSYAAVQSPKFTGQFPFTPNSGLVLVDGMQAVLETLMPD